jgi:hypothetical protein
MPLRSQQQDLFTLQQDLFTLHQSVVYFYGQSPSLRELQ